LAQLQKALAKQLEKLEHRRTTLTGEVAEAKQAPYHKKLGDLLTIHHANIPKKTASVTLPDDFDPHGAPITIPLDPAKTPAENAKVYFKKARKGKTGLPFLEKQLSKIESQLAALRQVQAETEQLTFSSPPGDEKILAHIESELARLGLAPKPKKVQPPARMPVRAKPQYKEFVTSEGFRVIVGRNNEENDRITLEVAKGDDFWFHAQQCPGAHVVLKLDGKREPGKRSLLEAAALAAHFSDARHSRKVPVIYTRAKYVRKPRKAKPGLVTVEREKSLMVPPALLPTKTAE
jgi:predicted ribosome quality control (RQC) complex YloA/Tae2 family protein